MTKASLIIFIIWSACMIAFGFFFAKNMYDVKLNIEYGDVIIKNIDTNYVKYNITILELPPSKVDIVTLYVQDKQEHQVYADTLVAKQDSITLSMVTLVDVNVDSKTAEFTYSDVEIKGYDKVITKTIEVPKLIEKEVPIVWYKDQWFYSTIGALAIIFGLLFGN